MQIFLSDFVVSSFTLHAACCAILWIHIVYVTTTHLCWRAWCVVAVIILSFPWKKNKVDDKFTFQRVKLWNDGNRVYCSSSSIPSNHVVSMTAVLYQIFENHFAHYQNQVQRRILYCVRSAQGNSAGWNYFFNFAFVTFFLNCYGPLVF